MGLRTRVFAAGTLLAALVALSSDAAAGPPADRLRQFFAATNAIITDEATATRPQEKLEAIRRLVGDLFAFREAAEHVLGAEWNTRTPVERDAFVSLFTDVAESSFVSALAARARLDGGAQVTVLGETVQGDTAVVKTVVAARSGSDIQVDYHMRWLAGRWMVGDVVLDRVSLADNYRAQARRVIERVSFDGLLAEMRERIRGGAGAAEIEVAALPERAARPPRTVPVAMAAAIEGAAGPGSVAPVEVPRASAPLPEPAEPAPSPAEPPRVAAAPTRAVERSPGRAESPRWPAGPGREIAEPARGSAERSRGVVAPLRTPAPPSRVAAEPPRVIGAASRGAPGTAVGRVSRPTARASTAAPPPTTSRPASLAGAIARPAPAGSSAEKSAPRRTSTARRAAAKARVVAANPALSGVWVQVGAYRTLEAVSEITARLRNQPIVIDMPEASEPILRVLVGPFRDHAGAVAALRSLRAKGLRPFIATID